MHDKKERQTHLIYSRFLSLSLLTLIGCNPCPNGSHPTRPEECGLNCGLGEGCVEVTDLFDGFYYVCAPIEETCVADPVAPVCGDGNLLLGEDCDDGNTTGGDGCSAACIPEFCGDGLTNLSQFCIEPFIDTDGDGFCDLRTDECDDGNRTDGDGCDSNCTLPGCGNAILNVGEQCDDGIPVNSNRCDDNCSLTFDNSITCGNGSVDPGELCYLPQIIPLSGDNAESLAVGDLNSDGALDIVFANKNSDNVSLFLGNGDGTFQTQPNLAVGFAAAVAVGDLNGDGALDIVTVNFSTVSVLLGNGNGTFQSPLSLDVSGEVVMIRDLNGDGLQDIVTVYLHRTSVLLGNGDGTFQPPLLSAIVGAAAIEDLNGDGALDIVTDGTDSLIGHASVLLGNGDGTFQPQQTFPLVGIPVAVMVRDLNGDGLQDIVTANFVSKTAPSNVSVLLGKGDGTFQSESTFIATGDPQSVDAGDLNGDGALDIVTANFDGTTSVLLGNGDGTFQSQLTFVVGNGALAVALAELNAQEGLDIIVLLFSNEFSVLLSTL